MQGLLDYHLSLPPRNASPRLPTLQFCKCLCSHCVQCRTEFALCALLCSIKIGLLIDCNWCTELVCWIIVRMLLADGWLSLWFISKVCQSFNQRLNRCVHGFSFQKPNSSFFYFNGKYIGRKNCSCALLELVAQLPARCTRESILFSTTVTLKMPSTCTPCKQHCQKIVHNLRSSERIWFLPMQINRS